MLSAEFSDPAVAGRLLEAIRHEAPDRRVNIMEVCGTHTMAIARAGLRSLLPDNIRLISGPGCPVCVTPSGAVDAVLRLSHQKNIVIATYGDMLRVPGSVRGTSLMRERAYGADVRTVYSPMDAVDMAACEPEKEFVFLGVGFETTAPGTASTVEAAQAAGLRNFSVFSMLKTVEPALRALDALPDFSIDAFLCPGHVATIIGEEGFRFIPESLGLPAVIAGFEPLDLLASVLMLIRILNAGSPSLKNEYTRAVRPEGNPAARALMGRVFSARTDVWRGLGPIPGSGLGLSPSLERYDAEKRHGLTVSDAPDPAGCRCGDVIRGFLPPEGCPLFGKLCVPEDPVGPCMVSSEGACAAAYKYRQV